MIKVYISGVFTSEGNLEDLRQFYEKIGSVCEQLGYQPYIPHLHSDPECELDLDLDQVLSSDLIIAYVGEPSVDVGMAIAYAEQHNIPIILMYEANRRVSCMALRLPERAKIAEVVFEDYYNGLSRIRQILEHWQQPMRSTGSTASLLRIREVVRPTRLYSNITILDKAERVIMDLDLPEARQEDHIKSNLVALKQQGVSPDKLYIPIWSKLGPILSEVWPNAKLLFDYQDE